MRYVMVIIAVLFAAGSVSAQEPFDECGIIEAQQLMEWCYRLNVGDETFYEIYSVELEPENAGDTVRVYGVFDPSGVSQCMYGTCCVTVDSMVPCTLPDEVPTASQTGLLVICFCLAVAAAWLFRNRWVRACTLG